MNEADLRRALHDAVDTQIPAYSPSRISARVTARGRRRAVARVTGVAVVAVVAIGGVATWSTPRPAQEVVTLADAEGLVPYGPAGPTDPTVLPPGAERCAGPTAAGALVRTTFCLPDGATVEVARGPHDALPEEGRAVAVADRRGYVLVEADVTAVTVSDANSLDDTHHRVSGPLDAATLAAIAASIPSVATAPPPIDPTPAQGR